MSGTRFTEEDKKDMNVLYDLGMNDRNISKVMECSRVSVSKWRNNEGLPPQRNLKTKHERAAIKDETIRKKVKAYHAKGYNDLQIGSLIGRSASRVGIIRNSMGLKSNRYIKTKLAECDPTPLDKPWLDNESLFCDTRFIEKFVGKKITNDE